MDNARSGPVQRSVTVYWLKEDEGEGEDMAQELDQDAVEAVYASSDEHDDELNEESSEDVPPNLARESETTQQHFMEHLACSTSFIFRDSGCAIGLQVRLATETIVAYSSLLPVPGQYAKNITHRYR